MKKYIVPSLFLGLACACALLISCSTNSSTTSATTAASTTGGHLMVGRVANFGGVTTILLSVDGKQVATIPRGQNYDGYLTPGKHTISATIAPNNLNSPVWTKTLNVVAGQTYSFTATCRR